MYSQGMCQRQGEKNETGVLRNMGGEEKKYKTTALDKDRRRQEVIQIIGKASKRQKEET